MVALIRRHPVLFVVFIAIDIVVIPAVFFLVVRGELSKADSWETYAGTYAARSGDVLELRDDGTWTMTFAQGTETASYGEAGGDVEDLCWIVLGRDEMCQACREVYVELPPGDPLIYAPSMVTSATRWAGSDLNVSTNGTYFAVQSNGSLVDEDGRRWKRVDTGG